MGSGVGKFKFPPGGGRGKWKLEKNSVFEVGKFLFPPGSGCGKWTLANFCQFLGWKIFVSTLRWLWKTEIGEFPSVLGLENFLFHCWPWKMEIGKYPAVLGLDNVCFHSGVATENENWKFSAVLGLGHFGLGPDSVPGSPNDIPNICQIWFPTLRPAWCLFLCFHILAQSVAVSEMHNCFCIYCC